MKSIVIIGKGYSIHRCTKKFIDSFDEVAIINNPVYENYERLISDHADYAFINNSTLPYSEKWKKKLNIKKTINIINSKLNIHQWFKQNYFNTNTNKQFGPPSGIMALEYFIRQKVYNKIGLVGYDLHQKGEKIYYFKKSEAQKNIKYLWNNGTFSKDDIYLKDTLHDVKITYSYLIETFKKNKDKEFHIITNYNFEKLDNVILY